MASSAPARVLSRSARSLPDLFLQRVAASGPRTAWKERRDGAWVATTWNEFHARASALATALMAMGLARGDAVTIVGATRGAWGICDLGGQLAGLVTVGAYPTLTTEQLAYVVAHSESVVVFVEDREQLLKVLAKRAELPKLRRIVVWKADAATDAERAAGEVVTLDELLRTPPDAAAIRERIGAIDRHDTAILVYTSGTTGPPKGAMITHDNLMASLDGMESLFRIEPDDASFSFLPLAHAAERVGGLYGRMNVGLGTAFASSIGAVLEELKEVRPTHFGSVPRIFEKAYARIQGEVEKASPGKRRVFRWAERVGVDHVRRRLAGQPIPLRLALQHRLAERIVFSRMRAAFGGRVKEFATGAAPIALPILELFWAAGFPIYEVYGMTEATLVTHANRPGATRLGSVGKPQKHVEARLADDGEVLLRGRVVFKGYFRDPEATAAAIDADGWLHTGDIGRLDADGYLYVVDRKKHILITSGGKNLTPANIENAIKARDPLIGHVHAHADRRPYVTALVTVSPLEALAWGAQNGVVEADAVATVTRAIMADPLSRPPELAPLMKRLCADARLRERIAGAVRAGNQDLSRVERVRRVLLLDRELSAADDELTPTLKTKRKNVDRRFQAEFDRLYEDASSGIVVEPGGADGGS